MAHGFISANGAPRAKQRMPVKPLTTQGKVEKARQQTKKRLKNNPKPALPTAKDADLGTPKRLKARSFAPPAELVQSEDKLKARGLAAKTKASIKNGKWEFSRGQALTTQHKEAQARAAKSLKVETDNARFLKSSLLGKSTGRNAASVSFGDTTLPFPADDPSSLGAPTASMPMTEATKHRKKHNTASKPLGLMKVLAQQSAVAMHTLSREAKVSSVLARPTRRALIMKETEIVQPASVEVSEPRRSHARDTVSLLSLPDEVRRRIWRAVIVNPNIPIWPGKLEDQEQPDLAMTCRQIRREVLAMYYAENVFAISLVKEGSHKWTPIAESRPMISLAAIEKWARILSDPKLEEGKWFGMIRNWAFDFEERTVAADGKNFLVRLRLGNTLSNPSIDSRSSATPNSGPIVEVHRSAACIMPGQPEHGTCIIQTNPGALNKAVIDMLQHSRLTAPNLIGLATEMKGMASKLSSARCTRSPK